MTPPLHLFPSVGWFQKTVAEDKIVFDGYENWVKQSYRNRFEIAGPNGNQSLSIPTVKATRNRFRDVEVSYQENWVTKHLRSIRTAYNRSPYYEYYSSEFEQLIQLRHKYLFDLNINAIEWCMSKLNLDIEICKTKEYSNQVVDEGFHELVYSLEYYQVFQNKTGFHENLSVLDLLFNVGPEALTKLLHKPPLN